MDPEITYCSACAAPLEETEWEDDLTLKVCPACGKKAYQNSKPCVVAIILNRETKEILLTKRGIKPFRDYWDMPGGFLRDGEDPAEGLKRELREELGAESRIEELYDILVDTYGEYEVYTFNVCYIVSLLTSELSRFQV